ncbi:MAG: thiamine phosphate synthase, partial [Thermodesulfobacteriota bacterium]
MGYGVGSEKIRGLYAIIDTYFVGPGDIERVAGEIIEGGARLVQLRAKGGGTASGEFLKMAKTLREITAARGATFIVNDRVDVALMSGADGVHLGDEDLPVAEARKILGKEKIIGFSTHTVEEAVEAATLDVDYISFGPIFPTATKPDAREVVGIDMLKEVRGKIKLPVTAIGGITEETLPEVISAGADAVAIISGILEIPSSKDIRAKVAVLVS